MDYDEMTDHIVEFEVGALYYITIHGRRMLALYLGLQNDKYFILPTHIFYVYSKNRNKHIANSQAIRMAYSLHKLITKVETDVTVTAR